MEAATNAERAGWDILHTHAGGRVQAKFPDHFAALELTASPPAVSTVWRRRTVGPAALHRARADLSAGHLLLGLPARAEMLSGVGDDSVRRTLRLEPVAGRAALFLRGALDGPQLHPGLVLPSSGVAEVPQHVPGAGRAGEVARCLTLLLVAPGGKHPFSAT